jgi:hypothetical protein
MASPVILSSTPRPTPGTYKLRIELVPEALWGVNLRSAMSATMWGQVGEIVFERAGGRCEICGGVGRRHPLECHEAWAYVPDRKLETGINSQILRRLEALCPDCHLAKHIGFAEKTGRGEKTMAHMARVNGISLATARLYVEETYETQRRFARLAWRQDIEWFRSNFPGRLTAERAAAKKLAKEARMATQVKPV